ncbi:MAG: hypothetical protein ACRC46_08815 [Thermoguttaceae bacterium]
MRIVLAMSVLVVCLVLTGCPKESSSGPAKGPANPNVGGVPAGST